MNSCRSIELAACTPPLITFIIGTGSVAARSPPRCRKSETPGSAARRLRGRERDAEDGVRAEAALVRRAVELDQRAVDRRLVAVRRSPATRLRDLAVHVGDGPRDALAAPLRAAVAQLDRLVDAGRGARRDRCAPDARRTRARRRPRRSDCRASRATAGRVRPRSHVIRPPPSPGRSSASCSASGELAPVAPVVGGESGRRPRPARRNRAVAARSSSSGSTFRRRATFTSANSTSPSSSATRADRARARAPARHAEAPPAARRSSSSRSASAPGDVRLVEADRGRAPLHLPRVEQRRQRLGGTSWKTPSRPSCSTFSSLPVLAHAAGGDAVSRRRRRADGGR